MKIREALGRADRLQQRRGFKLVASAAVVLIALAFSVGAVVAANTPAQPAPPPAEAGAVEADSTISNTDAAQLMLETVLQNATGPAGFVIGVCIVAALALVVIWMDLALTFLGILLLDAIVAYPLWLLEPTRDLAKLVTAILVLTLAFVALMRALRLLFAGSGPTMAVARNVLAEAVRLKLSVVFIVLLIFGLAALPGVLDADQPLRYRVQSFMQYGTGGAFWVIAVLTVAFSVSTVATEQRDKVIWQTMTKPVPAWKYLLGKWLGVSGLAAVLLAVSSSGVFLFVEYLRNQPAQGEREAFVALAASGMSEDRLVLETQILSSRESVQATEPAYELGEVDAMIAERLADIRQADPTFQISEEQLTKLREGTLKQQRLLHFAIDPGYGRTYTFEGLDIGPDEDVPIVLRYQIDAGSNRPDERYQLTIGLPGLLPVVRNSGLGHLHSLPIAPIVVVPPARGQPAAQIVLPDDPMFPEILRLLRDGQLPGAEYVTAGQIVENGTLTLSIANGGLVYILEEGRFVGTDIVPNPDPLRFPGGGLGVSYAVGSYHANYARSMVILWIKLAFLAMLGVFCSTFLSFSVASLVAFGTFLMAESASFLRESLDNYATIDSDQNIVVFKVFVRAISHGVAWLFETYAELSPVERLVNGETVGGLDLLTAGGLLGAWCLALFGLAVYVFRRRELAIYSGQ